MILPHSRECALYMHFAFDAFVQTFDSVLRCLKQPLRLLPAPRNVSHTLKSHAVIVTVLVLELIISAVFDSVIHASASACVCVSRAGGI